MMQPYRGLFVLDAAQGIAGPCCGMMLAALGAEVVKLEPPGGDWARGLTTRRDGQSVMSTAFNRGKRSIVLDLTTPEGRSAAQRLAARADVLIEAFRPGVAARLGLGPEAVKEDGIYLSVSGFGQQGPLAERPCTDAVMQAFSGIAALNLGADGTPHRVGNLLVDVHTGLAAFAAVQAALAERARDAAPRRRRLDVSLMAGAAFLLSINIAEAGLLGRQPAELNVPAGCYQARDGAFVMVALVREQDWRDLTEVLGLPELAQDPRFADFAARAAHKAELLPLLRARFATRDAAEWLAALQARRLLAERVNSPLEWLAHPHVQATGAAPRMHQPELGELPMPVLPGIGPLLAPAPALGQHTAEILESLGAGP
ncbi:MAG: CoA transferase [Rhodovarius sp.]|nr:CoA transferase [Rhodovarius sp.]MDW8314586.1 CoA transferase [Rhodovarius sp.]